MSSLCQQQAQKSIFDRMNRRPSSLPKVSDKAIDWERRIENRKSSVRCKVEHAFRIIKCQFGYKKTVYRGLMKNENRENPHISPKNRWILFGRLCSRYSAGFRHTIIRVC